MAVNDATDVLKVRADEIGGYISNLAAEKEGVLERLNSIDQQINTWNESLEGIQSAILRLTTPTETTDV